MTTNVAAIFSGSTFCVASAARRKFVRSLHLVSLLADRGETLDDCVNEICNHNGWCFLRSDELRMVENLYNYLTIGSRDY